MLLQQLREVGGEEGRKLCGGLSAFTRISTKRFLFRNLSFFLSLLSLSLSLSLLSSSPFFFVLGDYLFFFLEARAFLFPLSSELTGDSKKKKKRNSRLLKGG